MKASETQRPARSRALGPKDVQGNYKLNPTLNLLGFFGRSLLAVLGMGQHCRAVGCVDICIGSHVFPDSRPRFLVVWGCIGVRFPHHGS